VIAHVKKALAFLTRRNGAVHEIAKNVSAVARALGEPPRSPRWRTVEEHWLVDHNVCAVCGGIERLNVHHVEPFHLFPWLELADGTHDVYDDNGVNLGAIANLITLCMGEKECHLKIGHGGDFRAYNPDVRHDAIEIRVRNNFDAVEMRARINRQYA